MGRRLGYWSLPGGIPGVPWSVWPHRFGGVWSCFGRWQVVSHSFAGWCPVYQSTFAVCSVLINFGPVPARPCMHRFGRRRFFGSWVGAPVAVPAVSDHVLVKCFGSVAVGVLVVSRSESVSSSESRSVCHRVPGPSGLSRLSPSFARRCPPGFVFNSYHCRCTGLRDTDSH